MSMDFLLEIFYFIHLVLDISTKIKLYCQYNKDWL